MTYTADEVRTLASAVYDLVREWERRRLMVAQHYGISQSEVIALGRLLVEGPMTPGDLAQHLQLTSGSVTALIDRLVAGGLAQRDEHPDDRRRLLVSFTEAGATRIANWQNQLESVTRRALDASSASVAAATALVTALTGALSDLGDLV